MGGPPLSHFAGGVPQPTQLPLAHAVVGPHAWPQVPQLLLSVDVLTHAPLHAVRPPAQLLAHDPFKHTLPAPHTLLQAPQLFGSLAEGMHFPPQND
jgi:hypothetical protein